MSDECPLAGRRIVITRAREQSSELERKLGELGAEVIAVPTIEIVPPESYAPLDAALRAIASYEWLVVTSANAVRVLGERIRVLDLRVEQLQHLRFAAVGPATATAVEKLGFTVTVMPERYVAESLAEALRERTRGQRVLLVRAQVARDVVPETLRASGAAVEVVDAYRTIVPAGAVALVKEIFWPGNNVPDAVTFTSSSTVNNFFAVMEQADVAIPQKLKAVSIGPITSATLRSYGWVPAIQAALSTVDGLVSACVALLSRL